MPKDLYMCQLCANHGHYNQPKKGHKQKCPNRNCMCSLCSLNTRRRVLDRIERQIRKGDDNNNQKVDGDKKGNRTELNTTQSLSTLQTTENSKNRSNKHLDQSRSITQLHAFHSIELLLAERLKN
ncbi:DM domain-containing protein [Meloidogyne graminicola]|uniref:DM domain-containing protein n=1 Tax=Meloidogyne graminicola TaxID=189291 RepID=A0A8S9Z6B5_9BILA|nr:DM domain-containing protein [Meloidogyne graminicola]